MSKQVKRILLWSPKGAGLQYGGAGTNAYRLYSSSAHDDIRVTLACATVDQGSYSVFEEIVQIHVASSETYLDQAQFLWKAKKWLRNNALRFDVFHGIDIFDNTIRSAIWAEKYGLPAVVKPAAYGAGLTPVSGFRGLFRLPQKRRKLIAKLSGIVAISEEIERELLGYGVNREIVHRIPNGVDCARFRPAEADERSELRSRLQWKDDDFVLLFVGAIVERKRPDWLLDAVREIMESTANMRLVFVGPDKGDGTMDRLIQGSASYRWKDRVEFLGLREDVELIYRAADLFCLPSKNEGMPNAMLEAMASGLPCLATPVSGSSELVDDGKNGYFVNSSREIREKTLQYLGSPGLLREHGVAGRETALKKYSTQKVLAAHLGLFESVIAAKKSS